MKNRFFSPGRGWYAWLLGGLLTVLVACQDHGVPTRPEHGLRLKQIQVTAGRSLLFTDFFYDEQKRLSRQEEYNGGSGLPQNSYTFFYDGNNRLVRIENVFRREEGVGNRTIISYNAAGKPQLVSFYALTNGLQTATLSSTNDYLYNAEGQLTGFNKRFTASSQRNETRYTYTGKNITRIVTTTYLEGQSTPLGTQENTYAFDDKLNPYNGLLGLNWDTPHLLVNENNIINPEITYTYNSQGLLTRVFIPSPILPGIVNYVYEPY